MKNKMNDVRDHLVQMLEKLNDNEVGPEIIERAKATALVAGAYISAVKVELEALRLSDEIRVLPASIDEAQLINTAAQPPGAIPPTLVHGGKGGST